MESPVKSTDPAQPLQYQPQKHARRNRKIFQLSVLVIVLTIAYIAIKHGPTWYRTIKLLSNQRTCLNYSAPADQIVFETNPAKVAMLANDANYVIVNGCAYRKPPADWLDIDPTGGWGLRRANVANPPMALIYLHEFSVKNEKRLIGIERRAGTAESPHFLPGYDIEVRNFSVATLKNPISNELAMAFPIDVIDTITPKLDMRIYAGQPVANDPSRFTVRYENNGEKFEVKLHVDQNGWIVVDRTN